MSDYDTRAKFKPALVLHDSRKIKTAYLALIALFEKSSFCKGEDIIRALKGCCTKAEAEAITLSLADRGFLSVESGKFGFGHYEFSKPAITGIHADMDVQIEAAELLELIPRAPAKENVLADDCKVVATLPNKDSNFKFKEPVDLIYPHLQRMIAEARHSIFIVNPFFDDDGAAKVLPTLLAAGKSGVAIKLIVREAKESAKMRSSLKTIKDAFEGAGIPNSIEVREYFKSESTGQIYATHAKVVLVDDKECYLGSANITFPGMYYNFELGCILKGRHLDSIRKLLGMLWECSSRI